MLLLHVKLIASATSNDVVFFSESNQSSTGDTAKDVLEYGLVDIQLWLLLERSICLPLRDTTYATVLRKTLERARSCLLRKLKTHVQKGE